MRQCILHIGMNKTGTTSLQALFYRHEDDRLICPDLGQPNHSVPLVNAFRSDPEAYLVNRHQSRGPAEIAAQRARVRARLAEVMAGDKDMLLTAEGLSNALPAGDVPGFLAFLRPAFDRIRAIAYLREPRSFVCSLMQQRLRDSGRTLRDPGLAPDYRRRLGGWVDALAPEDIDLVQFHPDHLAGGDLVVDFCARLGTTPPRHRERRRNTALSAEVFAVLYAYRHAREGLAGRPDLVPVNTAVLGRLAAFGTTPLTLDHGFADALLSAERDDIAWAEARMGARFRPRPGPRGALAFRSERHILDHARHLAPRLHAWLAQGWPDRAWPPDGDAVTLMDGLFDACAETVRAGR